MKNNVILKDAFKCYFNELYPYNPNLEQELNWSFSPDYQFEKKMNKLICSQKSYSWKYTNSISKRIAIAIIVLIITFSTAMTVNAFREPIVDFIVKTYEKFSSFFIDKDSVIESKEKISETIDKKMIPQTIPKDFVLSQEYSDEYLCITMWKKSNNEYIEFYQYASSTAMNINTENVELNQIKIDDIILYYYTQDNITSYVWYKDGYEFSLTAPDYFNFNQIEKIIKSVK